MNREPSKDLFWLSAAVSLPVLAACIGIAIVRSSTLSLEIANTKLSTQRKASQVKELSVELSAIARQLEASEIARQELLNRYNELASNNRNWRALQPEIERVEQTAGEINVEEIKQRLTETTQELNHLATEE